MMMETGKTTQQNLVQWFFAPSVQSFWSMLGKMCAQTICWEALPQMGLGKEPYIHLSFSISISKCSHYRTPFAAALCWQNSPLLTWSWRKATGLFAWINSRLQPELELWLQKCCIAGLIYLLQNTGHKKNREVEIMFYLTSSHIFEACAGHCWRWQTQPREILCPLHQHKQTS